MRIIYCLSLLKAQVIQYRRTALTEFLRELLKLPEVTRSSALVSLLCTNIIYTLCHVLYSIIVYTIYKNVHRHVFIYIEVLKDDIHLYK
jgi:hypothetical protein